MAITPDRHLLAAAGIFTSPLPSILSRFLLFIKLSDYYYYYAGYQHIKMYDIKSNNANPVSIK